MESIYTPDEIAESNLRASIIGELIKARREKGISQKRLEELSGVNYTEQILIGTRLIEDKHEADEIINTVLNLIESSYANIHK